MLEVLFGESEAASLKYSPENKNEIVCLGLRLDIGDISEPVDGEYRRRLLKELFNQEQWGESLYIEEDIYKEAAERLRKAAAAGEDIRIWYDRSAYTLCGLYFVCSLFKGQGGRVFVVELPEYEVRRDSVVIYAGWGEVAPEAFVSYIEGQRELSEPELNMYAGLWQELAADNSPLRAVIGNRVVGVPEDFYDFLLWRHCPKSGEEPVHESFLIGTVLGLYPLGVFDWWYAKRIQHYIEQGEIVVVEDSDWQYARVIKLAEGS